MTGCDSMLLSRLLDDDLTPEENVRLRAHVGACSHCARELESFKNVDAILRQWGAQRTPLPASADLRITETVRRRRGRNQLRSFFALGRMTPAAVGSTIAAVLVLLTVNMHGAFPARTPTETAWARQQSSIKRQAAPLLTARRSSAILGGQVKSGTGTLGRRINSSFLN